MSNNAVIGLDLGGTKLAGAIFSPEGKMLCKNAVPLAGRKGRAVGELMRQELVLLLAAARARHLKISALGVSVPGISRAKTGKVWAPNIPGWADYPLRRELLAALGDKRTRIALDSDRACYILGETWRGAAKGCRNAIFLAVGTGIGAGVLVDGRILRGAHDIAGAIGWWALDRPFQREYVGCGCFEYHASGAGLAKRAKQSCKVKALQGYKGLTAQDVFAAYARGEPVAREVIAQAVEFWGMATANLVSIFNPEKIIFGGGVFGPGAKLLDRIYTEAKKWAQPISVRQVKLQPSRLGADAGLYGAACLALQAANSPRR